ncbi:Asp-tRNA(Asn)/Glu-tRNA(Gln) amidotransferase subunit GatA [Thalassospiraceae bacterium LMO-JJ14]|nr:Asp-tRNA(Asn)/Glu-tRNA(Gln) amidotransferase subunit GatA [Thalassospiraceae bacterium LMO-JJ14]
MSDLRDWTIASAADALGKGDVSSVELTDAFIDAMEAGRTLNAFITETPELARERAGASDTRRKNGDAQGPMDGVPIGMKDLFCTEGVRTTAASRILDNFIPTYESTVSGKLRDAGAVMLGKTNLDEFAMGSANITSYFGSVKNPWTPEGANANLVPGGSSGGSVAAVSGGLAIAATGTDTGGSIRQPASFTGLVGMKPTYGRCSRWGTVAFASSLDQAGPLTRTVEDAAIMLQVMSGHDPKDSTSLPMDLPDFRAACTKNAKGLRVGIPREYTLDGMPADIQKLWEQGAQWFRDMGAEIVEVSLPHTKYALPTYYIVAPAEASSNLARYDGVRYGHRVPGDSLDEMYELTRGEGFGAEVQRRVLIGTYVLSAGYYDAYYVKAQQVRTLIAEDFKNVFADVDVLLTPTAPSAAFAEGEKMDDPIAMYLNDVFTVPASLAGLPAISVPGGLDANGLPLGLQLISGVCQEETLFRAASALEQAANFTSRPEVTL